MRHRKAINKLNRTSSHRNAMLRNMVTSLFKYDRIQTTDAKAKVLRSWADHMVTLAKRGDLHARRQALALIREKSVVFKLFNEASDRYGDISGGYTRIVKIGRRPGDAAPISLVELAAPEKSKPVDFSRTAAQKKSSASKQKIKEKASSSVEAEKKAVVSESPSETEPVKAE